MLRHIVIIKIGVLMAVKVDSGKCLRCGGCVAVCPHIALDLKEHGIVCEAKKCIDCGICVNFCPVEALAINK